MAVEEGIFPHQCVHPDCDVVVQYDDEPWCFEHSPDDGSSLFGWSAQKLLREGVELHNPTVKHNVFEKDEVS